MCLIYKQVDAMLKEFNIILQIIKTTQKFTDEECTSKFKQIQRGYAVQQTTS